jgi:hypothetical protein
MRILVVYHDSKVILLAFVRSVASIGFGFRAFLALVGEEKKTNTAAAK